MHAYVFTAHILMKRVPELGSSNSFFASASPAWVLVLLPG